MARKICAMRNSHRWGILFLVVAGLFAVAPAQRVPQKTPLQRDVETLQQDVKDLTARVSTLETAVATLTKGPGPRADAARAVQGAAKGKLAIGMTLAEVRKLLGAKGDLVETTPDGEFYRFQVSNTVQALEGERAPERIGEHLILVTFQDGKATAFRRQELPQFPAREAPRR
jgi:cell division protein FtsB